MTDQSEQNLHLSNEDIENIRLKLKKMNVHELGVQYCEFWKNAGKIWKDVVVLREKLGMLPNGLPEPGHYQKFKLLDIDEINKMDSKIVEDARNCMNWLNVAYVCCLFSGTNTKMWTIRRLATRKVMPDVLVAMNCREQALLAVRDTLTVGKQYLCDEEYRQLESQMADYMDHVILRKPKQSNNCVIPRQSNDDDSEKQFNDDDAQEQSDDDSQQSNKEDTLEKFNDGDAQVARHPYFQSTPSCFTPEELNKMFGEFWKEASNHWNIVLALQNDPEKSDEACDLRMRIVENATISYNHLKEARNCCLQIPFCMKFKNNWLLKMFVVEKHLPLLLLAMDQKEKALLAINDVLSLSQNYLNEHLMSSEECNEFNAEMFHLKMIMELPEL